MEIFWKVKSIVHLDLGEKVKKMNEEYLVKAINVTDAEAIVTNEIVDSFKKRDEDIPEFEIKSVTATKILKVL